MKAYNWTDDLNLNITELDDQHREFLDMVNDLLLAMKEKRSKEIQAKLIDKLIGYAFYHFTKEERYLDKSNYPYVNQHKREHEAFVDKMEKFREDYNNGKITLSFDMIDFMSKWWINHIKNSDRKYLPYLEGVDSHSV